MSYHCLNAVVYVRNRVLRIGNGPERSAKHSRQLGAAVSDLLYRIKIVTMSCVVWTVLDGVLWNGHDLEKFFIAVSCRLSPDCVQILPNANRLSFFTMRKIQIGSESD